MIHPFVFAGLVILCAAAVPATTADPRLEALLRRARAAIHWDQVRAAPGATGFAGDARFFGTDASFRFDFDASGRFTRRLEGRLNQSSGYDGTTAWEVDSTGQPRVLEMEDRETLLLSTWFETGYWLAEECPLELSLGTDTGGAREALVLARVPGGLRQSRVFVDRETALPLRMSIPTIFSEQTWTIEAWRTADGFTAPGRIVHVLGGGVRQVYEVRSAAPRRDSPRFGVPASGPSDVRFDAKATARVEVQRAPTGHPLVHPRVNGKDIGWFILDTGAAYAVIDAAAAEAAGLPSFGETFIGGAGAETKRTVFREGRSFEIGPINVDARLPYLQMDLAAISQPLGRPIAGVIGYDLFRRSVAAIDMSAPSLEIFEPASFSRDDLDWQPLVLHGRHPHARARFCGDREGLFRLDTGGGVAAICFHSPAVEKHHLLDGRATREVQLGGAGGLSKARLGTIDRFEMAAQRFENPMAIFALPKSGALDDPFSEGTLGGGILGRFVMWLDYGRRRIAFTPSVSGARAGREHY
jgi:hypothetical protein